MPLSNCLVPTHYSYCSTINQSLLSSLSPPTIVVIATIIIIIIINYQPPPSYLPSLLVNHYLTMIVTIIIVIIKIINTTIIPTVIDYDCYNFHHCRLHFPYSTPTTITTNRPQIPLNKLE